MSRLLRALPLAALAALLVGCASTPAADTANMDKSPDAGKAAAPVTGEKASGIPKPTSSGLDPTK